MDKLIKWARSEKGKIVKDDGTFKIGNKWIRFKREGHYGEDVPTKELIEKTSHQPYFLAKKGDLISIRDGRPVVLEEILEDGTIIAGGYSNYSTNYITKIWTPKAKDYIFQWEDQK